MTVDELDAEPTTRRRRATYYGVRPKGRLGTCGFYPFPWTIVYVEARSEAHARELALPVFQRQETKYLAKLLTKGGSR